MFLHCAACCATEKTATGSSSIFPDEATASSPRSTYRSQRTLSEMDFATRLTSRARLERMEAIMLRDQVINFLEAAVVFLMLTNAFSIAAAAYALALVQRATQTGSRAATLGLFMPSPRWLRANNPTR